MPTNTYTALATITLTGTDAEITFASIPGTYRDLVIVWQGTSSGGNTDTVVSVNGDTSNTYPNVQMFGSGSSTNSSTFTRTGAYFAYAASGTLGNAIMQIMDYSATDKHKTFLTRYNVLETSATASRWANNSAITSLSVRATSLSFAAGSTFSLYGIAS